MTERDDREKVVKIKLNPGSFIVDYELVNAKGRRVEVGPIFRDRSTNSFYNQSGDVENTDRGIEWFREYGNA